MSKIEKKFIAEDAIGAEQILVENNSPIRMRNADDTENIETIKLDTDDVLKFKDGQTWRTFGTNPVDQVAPALDLDWATATSFYKEISANATFTFSNLANGKSIVLIVRNTSGSPVTVTLPTSIYNPETNMVVAAGGYNIYTFIRSNSLTFMSGLDGLA